MTPLDATNRLCSSCASALEPDDRHGLCSACLVKSMLMGGDDEPDTEADDPVSNYEILGEIGRGGMGVIYRARQRRPQREVALKMLPTGPWNTPSARQRFLLEVENVAGLDHPNIVPVYDAGELDGQPYFTMKLVTGGSMATRRRDLTVPRDRDLSYPAARRVAVLMEKVARAVHHAHQRGVLHRDLKPSNILLDDAGEPQVADFGLAKRMDAGTDDVTRSGELIGTPAYMAPEVMTGGTRAAGVPADVYALGALLYEFLTGSLPFNSDTHAGIIQAATQREVIPPSRLRPGMSRDLETICIRCLEKEPQRRFESAQALADDLERYLNGRPILAREVTAVERAWKWAKRSPATAVLGALAILFLIGGGVVSSVQWQRAVRSNRDLESSNERLSKELHISHALRLASMSKAQVAVSPAQALLMAAEAVETTRKIDGTVRVEAYQALLDAVSEVGGRSLITSPSPILTSAVAPFGGWVALGCEDGQIRTIEYASGTVHSWKAADGAVRSLAILPSQEYLYSWGDDGVIHEWHMNDKGEAMGEPRLFDDHHGKTGSLCVTANGQWLISAGADKRLQVRPVAPKVGAGKVMVRTELPKTDIAGIRAASDGTWILPIDDHRTVMPLFRFDASAKLLERHEIKGVKPPMHDADIDPAGHWLVTTSTDRRVRLFDLTAVDPGADCATIWDSPSIPDRLELAHDGSYAAVVCRTDDAIRLFPTQGGEPFTEKVIGYHGDSAVRCWRDGKWIFTIGGDHSIAAISVGGKAGSDVRLRGPESPIVDIQVLGYASQPKVLGFTQNHTVWLWDFNGSTSSLSPQMSPKLSSGTARKMACTPDRSTMVIIDSKNIGTVPLADLAAATHTPKPENCMAAGIAFSADGRWMALAGTDGVSERSGVSLIPIGTNKSTQRRDDMLVQGNKDWKRADGVAFHPDGRLFAGYQDMHIRTWQLDADGSSKVVHEYKVPRSVLGLDVSPDGRWLAVCTGRILDEFNKDGEGLLMLIDLSQENWSVGLRSVPVWPGNFTDSASTVEFSPDGSRLFALGSTSEVAVYDLKSDPDLKSPWRSRFGTGRLLDAEFLPDNRTIAVVQANGLTHCWVCNQPGETAVTLPVLQRSVGVVAGSAPETLFTCGEDGRVATWTLDVNQLLLLARKTAGRDWTPAERIKFEVE